MANKRAAAFAGKAGVYAALLLFSTLFLFPLYWMVTTGMKDRTEVFTIPPVWIPNPVYWENFIQPFYTFRFARYYLNSIVITALAVTGAVFSSLMAGYGFARYHVRGSGPLFIVMLSTMMLPSSVTLIPVFIVFSRLGLANTILPLVLPWFLGNAFHIFLMRQFFMGIPHDMEESARIDGANLAQILVRIMIPMVKPALAAITIFTFIWSWNDFMGPLLYLSEEKKFTVMLALNFFKNQHSVQWNLLMAASTLATIPCLTVFALFQRYFVEGIALSGIKG